MIHNPRSFSSGGNPMTTASILKVASVAGAGADPSGQTIHILMRGADGEDAYLELPIEAAAHLIEATAVAMGVAAVNQAKAAGDAVYDPRQIFHFYQADSFIVSPMTEIGRVGVGFGMQHGSRLAFGITAERARELADDLYETAATVEKAGGSASKTPERLPS
jgi:hypothetical protein